MAGKVIPEQTVRRLLNSFFRLPVKLRLAIAGAGLVAVSVFLIAHWIRTNAPAGPRSPTPGIGPRTVVLCVWNVENLFDDRDDRRRQPDEEFDSWFVTDPDSRRKKYERIAETLVRLNAGHGPDILAANEVESVRCPGTTPRIAQRGCPRMRPVMRRGDGRTRCRPPHRAGRNRSLSGRRRGLLGRQQRILQNACPSTDMSWE